MSDLVLRGVPLNGSERRDDLERIVARIADFIGLKHSLDIESVRVFSGSANDNGRRQKHLFVRFATVHLRKVFFDLYLKVADKVNTRCLGLETDQRVYISDNLTNRNSVIRRRAKEHVDEGRLQKYSVRDGLVYVQLIGDDAKHPAMSERELDDLIAGRTHKANERAGASGSFSGRGRFSRGNGGRGANTNVIGSADRSGALSKRLDQARSPSNGNPARGRGTGNRNGKPRSGSHGSSKFTD